MTKEEAKQLISNICQNVRGTLADHVKIQEALKVLEIVESKNEKNK